MVLSAKKSLSFATGALLASAGLVFSCEDGSSSAGPSTIPVESGAFDSPGPPSQTDASTDASIKDAASDADTGVDAATPLFAFDGGPDCRPVTSETTLSPAAAGFPTTGLALWLRSDRGVYGSMTAGGAVCAWLDLSGGTTVFTPGASSAGPAWLANGINGQPALQFSASTQALATAGVLGIGATSARTIIAVEKLTSANGRFSAVQQGQGGSPGVYIGLDANTWQTAGNLEGSYVTNNSFDTATATTTADARVHVLTVGAMTVGAPLAGAVSYRIDGQDLPLSLRAGSGTFEDFSSANYTAVGGFGTPSMGGTTTGGIVAEVLVYNRALTPSEIQAVEAALKARYGTP